MSISLIVAMANNNVIGISSQNKMPWHLPADLKYFREKTLYKPVIMGRKTFESIGRGLPYRTNIIISSDTNYIKNSTCLGLDIVRHSLNSALETILTMAGEIEEIMVIGGGSIYKQALPLAKRLYITKIHADIDGDVYFPEFEEKDWELVSKEDHSADDKNKFNYSFCVYERV